VYNSFRIINGSRELFLLHFILSFYYLVLTYYFSFHCAACEYLLSLATPEIHCVYVSHIYIAILYYYVYGKGLKNFEQKCPG